MASLLSDAEKQIYEDVRIDIFDTFSEDIIVYSAAQETPSQDAEFNSFFQNRESSINYTPVSTTIKACVKFNPKQTIQTSNQGAHDQQIDVTENLGDVRIKVRAGYKDLVKEALNIQIRGEFFELLTTSSNHGLFSTQVITFYLKRKV